VQTGTEQGPVPDHRTGGRGHHVGSIGRRFPGATQHREADPSSDDEPGEQAGNRPVPGMGIAITIRRGSVTDRLIWRHRQGQEVPGYPSGNRCSPDDQGLEPPIHA
jgi:hypothetical protein